ncbi:hypothetical protein [Neochlamydia sp. AcF95]|uniref:hypothetical protein n=2 Tax=unclassified Neochlamydia TaxID=2643326 RepID=UPI001BC9AE6F|nr:hypothetical protein [Neochlamydia sp. AcF95]
MLLYKFKFGHNMAARNINELGSRAFHIYEGPTHQADKREKIGNLFYFFANVAFGKKIIFQKDGYSVKVRSLALRILAGMAAIVCFKLTIIGRILIASSASHRLAFDALVNMHCSSANSLLPSNHNSSVDSYVRRSYANTVIKASPQKGFEGLKKVKRLPLNNSSSLKPKSAVLNAPFVVTPKILSSVKLKPIQPGLPHASAKANVNTSLSPLQATAKQITKSSSPISSLSVPYQETLMRAHLDVASSESSQQDLVAHKSMSMPDLLLNMTGAFWCKLSQLKEKNTSSAGEEKSPIEESEWELSDDDQNGQFDYTELDREFLNKNRSYDPSGSMRSATSKNSYSALGKKEKTSEEDQLEKASCQELLTSSLNSLRLAIAQDESDSEEESLDFAF